MNLVEQVKEDAQMLFDKRDVLKLLEKQKAEDIEKVQQWAEWMQEQKGKEIETLEAYLQKTEKILTEKCDDVARLIRENQKLQEEKEQMIEKACSFLSQHLRSTEYQGHPNNDTFLKSWFMACIKQAMKGE